LNMGRTVETVIQNAVCLHDNYRPILRCYLEEELNFAIKKPLLWLWIC
jgi:hypothetical protein